MSNKVALYDLCFDEKSNMPSLLKMKETCLELDIQYSYEEMIEGLNKSLHIDRLHSEHSYIIAMNSNANIIGIGLLGVGNGNECCMDYKVAFQYLFLFGTDRYILIHNHQNGNYSPSDDDLEITNSFIKYSYIMDMTLLDHIIISKNGWYAIVEEYECCA